MNEWTDERIRATLKAAFPSTAPPEPGRDLWPEMLRRMKAPAFPVHWFDWALAALAALLLLLLPAAAPILFYFL